MLSKFVRVLLQILFTDPYKHIMSAAIIPIASLEQLTTQASAYISFILEIAFSAYEQFIFDTNESFELTDQHTNIISDLTDLELVFVVLVLLEQFITLGLGVNSNFFWVVVYLA